MNINNNDPVSILSIIADIDSQIIQNKYCYRSGRSWRQMSGQMRHLDTLRLTVAGNWTRWRIAWLPSKNCQQFVSVLFSVTSRLSLADPVWLDLILIELAAAGSSWQSNPNEIKVKISWVSAGLGPGCIAILDNLTRIFLLISSNVKMLRISNCQQQLNNLFVEFRISRNAKNNATKPLQTNHGGILRSAHSSELTVRRGLLDFSQKIYQKLIFKL